MTTLMAIKMMMMTMILMTMMLMLIAMMMMMAEYDDDDSFRKALGGKVRVNRKPIFSTFLTVSLDNLLG